MRNDEMDLDVQRSARPTRSAEAAGAWSVVTVLWRFGPRIAAMNGSLTLSRLAALGLIALFGAIMLSAPWFAEAQDDTTPLSAAFDLDTDNDDAKSMWSDGTTLWVGDDTDAKLYAYKLVEDPNTPAIEYGTRDSTKDIPGASGEAYYVTGDDTYLYVAAAALIGSTRDVFAYTLSDRNRASSKDFQYVNPPVIIVRAAATDGKHLWLSPTTSSAYAFRLVDDPDTTAVETYGSYDSSRTRTFSGIGALSGLYTDGVTMWATGGTGSTVGSVKVADGTAADCDFTLDDDNDDAFGIWSDGPTMYVVDEVDDKVYTYVNPCPPPEPNLIIVGILELDISRSRQRCHGYLQRSGSTKQPTSQCDGDFNPAVEHRRDCGYGFDDGGQPGLVDVYDGGLGN